MNFLAFLIVLLSPLIFFACHLAVCRMRSVENRQKQTLFAILLAWIFTTASAVFVCPAELPISAWIFLILAPGLYGHTYFHFFNMSETARRIRILVRLNKGVNLEAERQRSPAELIQIRLQRLLLLKEIEFSGGRYFSKGGLLSRVATLIEYYERLIFPSRYQK